MKDLTFNGKDYVSIIALLQYFKATYNVYNTYWRVEMSLLEQYHTDTIVSVIKADTWLSNKTAKAQESYLITYHVIDRYLLKGYTTEENISIVDVNA